LSRGDLTDAEWRILNPLLPDWGEHGPTVADRRRTVNGILWVLRTGAPWRDTPERYGNWNSVIVRFSRWSKLGVWDAAFETLASLGPPADEEHALDPTIVRAHQHAAGVKGEPRNCRGGRPLPHVSTSEPDHARHHRNCYSCS
jgi:transposase